jgi:hypothetical protein
VWRADTSITAGVYNKASPSAALAASAELWDITSIFARSVIMVGRFVKRD